MAIIRLGQIRGCRGFPGSSADKESACNTGDLGSIPGLGRSPGEGKGYPLQYSGLENSMDSERLLLNDKMLGFLASGGDELNLGPETRLDRSELLCNKVLLKYKGDRESF